MRKYRYIRVPVSETEEFYLKRLAQIRRKTPGKILHEMAYHRESDRARIRDSMKALEQLSDIHAEIIRTLRQNPSSFDMYESDLIDLDDRITALAFTLSAVIGGD